jgi:hypothetical protein
MARIVTFERRLSLGGPINATDDVVQIRCGSAAVAATEFTGLLQLGHGTGIRRMAIHVDDAAAGCRRIVQGTGTASPRDLSQTAAQPI